MLPIPQKSYSSSPALTIIGGEVVFESGSSAKPENEARTAEPAR